MSDLPASLARNPRLSQWIYIETPGRICIRTGKVEIGQGILTALRLIAAEELDVDPERIDMSAAVTGVSPNEFITAGSMSVEHSGAAIRQAAAHARQIWLTLAAQQLGTAVDDLHIADGTIGAPGLNATTDFWSVHSAAALEIDIDSRASTKHPSDYRLLGRVFVQRVDLDAKIRGEPCFVHDLRWPGMLHARIVRPPGPQHRLIDLQLSAAVAPATVVDGSFVAVLAERERDALRLCEQVAACAVWTRTQQVATSPPNVQLANNPGSTHPLIDGVPSDGPAPPLSAPADRLIEASYSRPFILHASIGPSAAAAHFDGTTLTVWSATQSIEFLRLALADALALNAAHVIVHHVQGAGCYGHNGADDVAFDAALCAQARPATHVLVQWSREDEHRFEPAGPAMQIRLRARLHNSRVSAWRHDVSSFTHSGRPRPPTAGAPRTSALLAAAHRAAPLPTPEPAPARAAEVGIHRNALPIYSFPQADVIKHFVANSPIRTSSLRGLGAQGNVFAIESFMDELATAAGLDPIAFRRTHLPDARARAVLAGVAELASGLDTPRAHRGRGIGIARYKNAQCCAAVIAEVKVDPNSAVVRATELWICADAGCIVDRDGIVNQLEGGAIQATSWSLYESVPFDVDGVACSDWDDYPILRFDAAPRVTTRLIDRPDQPSLGAGEATVGPTSAALANAVAAATGLRVRVLPLTPDRLRATAAETGKQS